MDKLIPSDKKMNVVQRKTTQSLEKCNTYTERYGLALSSKDIASLLESRSEALKEQERLELGESILPRLVYAFCDSPFVYQDNYVDVLSGLQDIFYFYKNESMDELSDDELIEYMKDMFNGECQGSLEYLEETCLDRLARDIREGLDGYIGGSPDEDDL
jgi:hypothetical protein